MNNSEKKGKSLNAKSMSERLVTLIEKYPRKHKMYILALAMVKVEKEEENNN